MSSKKKTCQFSNKITIKPEFQTLFRPENFLIPRHYENCVENILIPSGLISDRVERMASDYYNSLTQEDRKKPILAMCVLKGANQYFNDLIQELKNLASHDKEQPPQILVDFVRLKSYSNTESTGNVQVIGMDDLEDITDKHLLIVEDMVDTGRTLKKLMDILEKYKPASVKITTLLQKSTDNKLADRIEPDMVGFEVPDAFIIGYGIDYNENFRDLKHVCTISKFGIDKYKQK